MIDEHLVRRLLSSQLPDLAHLPVRPVPLQGNDNRTFRLGDELTVRLPSAEGYVAAVAKEQRWLPVLAARLPVPVPEPVALGVPGEGYPFPWSVHRWVDGEPALTAQLDESAFASDLASFLVALQRVDATDGPIAGEHSFFRGASLEHYDAETRRCVDDLGASADRDRLLAAWDDARSSAWARDPVWFHGDVAAGNLLVRDGRLAGVIDFGTCGVGDPACDLVIAFTMLGPAGRAAFRDRLGPDDATWARGRGWALWKALLTRRESPASPRDIRPPDDVLAAVLADHEGGPA